MSAVPYHSILKIKIMLANFILSDFLTALRVPHTPAYTNRQVGAMPLRSLFGLSKLLEKYGVASEGLMLSDRDEIRKLTPPFLAHTPQGFVIVTGFGGDDVSYLTQGVAERMPVGEFGRAWDGVVFLAFPSADACEPGYAAHERMAFFDRAKRVMLVLLAGRWLLISSSPTGYGGMCR